MSIHPDPESLPEKGDAIGLVYIADLAARFDGLRRLAERAVEQIDDAAFFATLDPEANSIAVLMKHMSGNLRSRFTDFLTTDGEKPDRDRDSEFVIDPSDTRATILARWAEAWNVLAATLESLTAEDLLREVTIRREPHTVIAALTRQLAHQAQHVGQIVLLAKHAAGSSWRTLSIPRGQSAALNQEMEKRHGNATPP